MKLLYFRDSDMIVDLEDVIVLNKKNVIEFTLPDSTTDYLYDPTTFYLYYVVDGKLRNAFIPNVENGEELT